VYVYFDNDVKVKAPFDALSLTRKLGLEWGLPVHKPGARIPRLRMAYGPRVTGGNPGLGQSGQARHRQVARARLPANRNVRRRALSLR
jgi:hypothetical protein